MTSLEKAKKTRKLKLWHKVIIGMVAGVLTGWFLGENAVFLKPIGTIFMTLLKMIVIPLIFFAILYGVTSLNDSATFTRLGSKAVAIYSCTTAFAVTIGILFANIFKPGIGLDIDINLHSNPIAQEVQHGTVYDILMGIVPSNPIQSMASGNTMQVVFFALFSGFALILIGNKGHAVREFIVSGTYLVFKMIELIMKLTPYGVFALMAWVVGDYGLGVITVLGKFVMVVLGALFLQYLLFGCMLLISGLNPLPFYKKMTNIQALAFATSSSKATLSTAMQDLRKKMGASKQASSFILPLGASMNMDATAIYLGICTVFFAQITGVELSASQYLIVILTSTIGSIGAAGFPGGSMVMMGMVLTSVGLPIEGMSLILGIDRFLDMVRTTINITGDCAVTLIVDKLEKGLNKTVYYSDQSDE
ncbi:MAG: dicarboxylate/amino acid:cation symporter [Proteobacteria bacterium]|nr:dicarboxylate/amino acid:cation symporter [Pseudomonadota bacterium]